jgi:uncharacterized protein (DUF58 family)
MPEVSTQHDAALPPPEGLARGDFDLVVRRLADDMVFGTDASLFVGGGLEYASSRPYQIGDSVRLLNWRLTARTGRPYVRQYEALKRIAVYIVVDTSASMSVGSTARSKHDIAVWMASALGLIAQRRMSPVAIVGAGERTVPITPSLIRNDLWRAIEPLRLGDVSEQTHLGERLERLTMRAGRRSVFVVISDLHDPAAIGALRHAAQKHDCMVIHTQDPAEITPLRAGFYRGQEAETGRGFFGWGKKSAVEAHRVAETRAELLRCGVDYLAVRTDESFIGPLRHFLASRGAAMRGRG